MSRKPLPDTQVDGAALTILGEEIATSLLMDVFQCAHHSPICIYRNKNMVDKTSLIQLTDIENQNKKKEKSCFKSSK